MAYHVLKSAGRIEGLEALLPDDGKARAWLDGRSPAATRDYLPCAKPESTTPAWTRILLAASFVGLCLLGSRAVISDLGNIYLPWLSLQISRSKPGAVDPRLAKAFEVFRRRAEPRLAAAVAASDVDSRGRVIEFLKGRGVLPRRDG